MRVAILSDQHGNLPSIPPCDLMILSGDLTGGPSYIDDKWRPDLSDGYHYAWLRTTFNKWVRDAPHTIAIAGNHDTCIEIYGFPILDNVTYLQDSGCEFNGLKFWGTPWIKSFDNLAFNDDEVGLRVRWGRIPQDTDVMVCHMPPYSSGDIGNIDTVNGHHVGSVAMRNAIERVQPKLVTCGHIHEGRGEYLLGYRTRIVNTACEFTVVDL